MYDIDGWSPLRRTEDATNGNPTLRRHRTSHRPSPKSPAMRLWETPLSASEPTTQFRSDWTQHQRAHPCACISLQPHVEHAPDFHPCRVEKLQLIQPKSQGSLWEYLACRIKQQGNFETATTLDQAPIIPSTTRLPVACAPPRSLGSADCWISHGSPPALPNAVPAAPTPTPLPLPRW